MSGLFKNKKHCRGDFNRVFGDDEGRRVLHDILQYCHVMEGVTTSDPNQNLVIAGRRDVATHIMQQLNLNVEDLPELVRESIDLMEP